MVRLGRLRSQILHAKSPEDGVRRTAKPITSSPRFVCCLGGIADDSHCDSCSTSRTRLWDSLYLCRHHLWPNGKETGANSMSTWILIWAIVTTNSSATSSQVFHSKNACELAQEKIQSGLCYWPGSVRSYCIEDLNGANK